MSDCAYGKGYLLDKLPTRVEYVRWRDKDRDFIGAKKSVISLAKEALNLQARIQLDHINLIQFLKKQWNLAKLHLNVILNEWNQNMLLI